MMIIQKINYYYISKRWKLLNFATLINSQEQLYTGCEDTLFDTENMGH